MPLRHPWWPKSGHPAHSRPAACSPSVPVAHCSLSLSRSPASGNLDRQTGKGSTALHYCCLTDNAECLKLLLRGKASIEIGERPAASRPRSLRDTGTVGRHWAPIGAEDTNLPSVQRGSPGMSCRAAAPGLRAAFLLDCPSVAGIAGMVWAGERPCHCP